MSSVSPLGKNRRPFRVPVRFVSSVTLAHLADPRAHHGHPVDLSLGVVLLICIENTEDEDKEFFTLTGHDFLAKVMILAEEFVKFGIEPVHYVDNQGTVNLGFLDYGHQRLIVKCCQNPFVNVSLCLEYVKCEQIEDLFAK